MSKKYYIRKSKIVVTQQFLNNMSTIINNAIHTFRLEAEAISNLSNQLTDDYEKAVKAILECNGKVIVTGMGKSGIIGKKIAATLASTGTSSFFMHPGEAYHGDLGMISDRDIIIAISNSGETDEILKLIPFLEDNKNSIISMTGNPLSTLAIHSHYHLNIAVKSEACPLKLAPTTSTTAAVVMGDALAISLMKERNFKSEDYARFHPGGNLGRRLLTKVGTIMRTNNLPVVSEGSSLTDIINTMSKGKLGLAIVNNDDKHTIGIITDGDLRRLMEIKGKDAFDFKAYEIMTKNPKTIHPQTSLIDAEKLFIDYKINSLIVVEESGKTIGVIQIYNL